VALFDLALLSHPGTSRPDNQDACGSLEEEPQRVLVVVADGVGGADGGEEASRLAVDVTIDAFRQSPVSLGSAKRLARAVQEANIAIHDRAMIVPELRHMRSTITAIVVDGRELSAAHVGDCRLYLGHAGGLVQLTKDHTVAAGRARLGLLREDQVSTHPERSTLTRCLGNNLLVSMDRLARGLGAGDLLLACSDGLYSALDDRSIHELTESGSAEEVCRALIDCANARGTPDNVTAAVLRMPANLGLPERPSFAQRLNRFLGR
jgi:serine/threonine protein phosphatase PrpC